MNAFTLRRYEIAVSPLLLRDKEREGHMLDAYLNDIYHLFLNRLVKITHQSVLSDVDAQKLQDLLKEIIKVKKLLEKID